MSELYVNYNGEIISANTSMLSIHNRAFKYGDGVFETIRIMNGNICFLKDHFQRLLYGIKLLKMSVPIDFTYDKAKKEIISLLDSNQIQAGGRVRWSVFRKDGGYYAPMTNHFDFLIEAEALPENNYLFNKEGYAIDVFEEHKKPIGSLFTVKTGNALIYVLASIEKENKKVNDCILLNAQGNLAEAISSNIFIVKKEVLYTPSLEQGCVAGVMRKQIIALAESIGIKVMETTINKNELANADELFLTNVIHGIRWVAAYHTKRYYNKQSRLLFNKLNEYLVGDRN